MFEKKWVDKDVKNEDWVSLRTDIALRTKSGKISKNKMRRIIRDIKSLPHGNDFFTLRTSTIEKQKSDWDNAYLLGLAENAICLGVSEESLLHMADVADYVYKRLAKKIAVGLLFIIAVVVIVKFIME